jgi:acetylornithine aminotransferase
MKLFDVYPLYNTTPKTGKDVYIYDNNNTKYLDLYGGHAVISIGHSHPHYIEALQAQLHELAFYSNVIKNPLQTKLAEKLGELSGCENYNLFLCNSGAEANENALKIASFNTGKKRVIAFKNSFHGRTSAAVAVTDNKTITAPINTQHEVTFLDFNDFEALQKELSKKDVCAVITETIQGVGGLNEATTEFYQFISEQCKKYNALLIIDEIQSGYGRTGNFFAFQQHAITPDIITIAKGMGNGFPIGGVLLHPNIKAEYGMLGTTFGGNHLACAAGLAVLTVIEKENLIKNAQETSNYLIKKVQSLNNLNKIKGRGLMLGLEFSFEVSELRKELIYNHHIFTGSSNNKKLLRILPPLTLKKEHVDVFINSLNTMLT